MIRPGAIVMTVLMTAVAVGVYFGLDYLPQDMVPGMGKQKEQAAAQPGDEKPQVDLLASGVEDPIAPATADNQSAVVTEEDLAEEPPPTEAAPAMMASPPPSAASTVDYDPPAGGAGVPVEEEIASAAPVAAAPKPAPTPKPAPKPASVSAPAAEPAPAQQPAKVAKAAPVSESPRELVKKAPQADVIKPWWPDPATIPANQLKLHYAGQVQNELAIALLFSAPLNLETLKQHAQVRNSVGDLVMTAQWELAKNPRMAVLRGVGAGRYTVILAPAVADSNGFLLGMALQGPVYIQAQ